MRQRKLVLAVLFVLILALSGGCAVLDGARMLKENAPNATASPSPLPKLNGIGDTCERAPWQITLVGKKTFDTLGEAPLLDTPADGKVFLVLFFDVVNVSESGEYFNYVYFDGKADGKEAELTAPATNVIDGRKIAIGSVPSGETFSCYVVWQVPADWKTFTVSYDTGEASPQIVASFEITA